MIKPRVIIADLDVNYVMPLQSRFIEEYADEIELEIITDSVGYVSDQSVSWISNGIEYYVSSSALTQKELIDVAKSMSVMPVGK